MKQILFTVMTVLLFVGCSKDSQYPGELEETISFMHPYKSKDSIYQYAISPEFIYKQERSSSKIIWKKKCTQPNPIKIDLGYGEKQEVSFSKSLVLLEANNLLFVLWRADNVSGNTQIYNHIGLYSSLSGDFIKNSQGEYFNKYGYPAIVEMGNNKFLVLNTYREGGYSIIDNNLDIIELNDKVNLYRLEHLEFLTPRRYITYADSNIVICDLDSGSIWPDISQFLKSQYPNEINPPKYTISNVSIFNSYINATVNVILHSGETNSFKIKINCDTGIIE